MTLLTSLCFKNLVVLWDPCLYDFRSVFKSVKIYIFFLFVSLYFYVLQTRSF